MYSLQLWTPARGCRSAAFGAAEAVCRRCGWLILVVLAAYSSGCCSPCCGPQPCGPCGPPACGTGCVSCPDPCQGSCGGCATCAPAPACSCAECLPPAASCAEPCGCSSCAAAPAACSGCDSSPCCCPCPPTLFQILARKLACAGGCDACYVNPLVCPSTGGEPCDSCTGSPSSIAVARSYGGSAWGVPYQKPGCQSCNSPH